MNPHPTPKTPLQLPTALLNALRDLIAQGRQRALRAVDRVQVQTCWEIGHHIVEFEQEGATRAVYGQRLLPQLADTLTREFGKGFDASNLRYMRLFYQAFPIRDALRHELSWTHYRTLLRVEDAKARQWYMNEAASQNWSARALDRQINTLYFERLLLSSDKAGVTAEAHSKLGTLTQTPREFVRDPVMLEFLGLPGVGKLTHQDIGQMDMYVRMYDDLRRGEGDNPTVGILLCEHKDQSVVRYSVLNDSAHLFASKYKLVLPSEDELRAELEREKSQLLKQRDAP